MDTTAPNPFADGRRRRRRHSSEFKAQVVAACCQTGASIASVALANGVNANLARRWVLDAQAECTPRRLSNPAQEAPIAGAAATFIPLELPAPAAPPPQDIRIEVTRGATKIVVTWPLAGASDCAALMREVLR